MSLQLTDADIGKKFITRSGNAVILKGGGALKWPYSYYEAGTVWTVTPEGRQNWDDTPESDHDLVARYPECGPPQTKDEPAGFTVKDSGARQVFASGMVRDTGAGKIEYDRVLDGPMFPRWAEHLTRGAAKYPDLAGGRANWTLAGGEEELRRFRRSAMRHFMQWFRGDTDEDHAAAIIFNINGAEYVREKLAAKQTEVA